MKHFLYLFFIVLSTSSFSQIIELKDIDNRNNIVFKKGDSIPYSGKCIIKFNNGKTSIESSYRNGLLDGIEKAWLENGNKYSESSFVNGKYEGTVIYWFPNGNKKSVEIYKNDYKNGLSIYYHENGEKSSKGNYINCYEEGLWNFWDQKGKKIKDTYYKKGEIVEEEGK